MLRSARLLTARPSLRQISRPITLGPWPLAAANLTQQLFSRFQLQEIEAHQAPDVTSALIKEALCRRSCRRSCRCFFRCQFRRNLMYRAHGQ